jgi:transcriptional regulator with XRE-family HTH domain
LRREEVALLAGVGVTWYTWLEQGRDVKPSTEVLAALADALRLDQAERAYLYQLNDRPPQETRSNEPERIELPLRRMLDSLAGQPAYILGRRWDVLAWNRAAKMLFGDYGELEGDERNIIYMVFANKAHRKLLLDWDELAPRSLAMFRADVARHAGDPDFERLIRALTRISPEFRQLWRRQDVLHSQSSLKRVKHPVAGRMTFEYTSFTVTAQPDLKFIVYTPLQVHDTIAKLDALLAG